MAILGLEQYPKTILPAVKTAMDEGRELYVATSDPFVMDVESTLPIENYVLYGAQKGPQVFTGEVTRTRVSEYSQNIPNVEYFDAAIVKSSLLKYAQNGRIEQHIKNFGYEWNRGVDKLRIEQLGYGASNNCYDGTPFFGASHLDGDSGVQSNIFTGASGFDATTFQVHAAAMSAFKDDRGEVMGKKVTHVIVQRNSAAAVSAKQLANSTYDPSASTFATNTWQGTFQVVEVDYMPTNVKFITADLSNQMAKPIIFQRAGAEILTAHERDSEWFADHKEYKYTLFQDFGIGYGDWRNATLQI